MHNSNSLKDANTASKNETFLVNPEVVLGQQRHDHRYCHAHEQEMTMTETDTQIMYKCPHCSRSYIELKDTAAGCNRKKR